MGEIGRFMRKHATHLVERPARNTILVESREGLWRMIVYPDEVQMFRSRELAEAHAQERACSQEPPWTVIVREPASE